MGNNALASISAIVLNKTQFKTLGWIKEVFSGTKSSLLFFNSFK